MTHPIGTGSRPCTGAGPGAQPPELAPHRGATPWGCLGAALKKESCMRIIYLNIDIPEMSVHVRGEKNVHEYFFSKLTEVAFSRL